MYPSLVKLFLLQLRHESNFQVTDTKAGSVGRKQWETERVKDCKRSLEQSKNIVGEGQQMGWSDLNNPFRLSAQGIGVLSQGVG